MQSLKELFKIGNGPSSSHTMGPKKAALYFLSRFPNAKRYEVYLYGSLALTGKGHLTDRIIYETFSNKNVKVIFDIDKKPIHPNEMDFIAYDDEKIGQMTAYSVGGGSIEVLGEPNITPKEVYALNTYKEIKEYCCQKNISICDYVYEVEKSEIKDYLSMCFQTMKNSIKVGLEADGVLPGKLMVQRKAKALYNMKDKIDTHDRRIISAYAYAVSETNASGGIIVTSPTCGASGVLPSILKFAQDKYNFEDEKMIDSLAVAGIIGNLIKKNASISGAECGCQAEVGAACAMASASLAYLMGLNNDQIEYSAEMAIEHFLGLTCDPILGYVQIPCIERNAIAAMRAIDNVTLAYYITGSRKISFDMITKTMKETGLDIQATYKETSKGGMAKYYKIKN